VAETGLRIDKWLWHARFARTRTLAQKLVEAGSVRVNRVPVRAPSHPVRIGDTLTLALGGRILVVRALAHGLRRGPATDARLLYETVADSAGRTSPPPADGPAADLEPDAAG